MEVNVLNSSIILGFLLIIFMVGRLKKEQLSTIYNFSIGNREFYTSSIIFTLIATWISASGFNIDLTMFYDKGWLYLLPALTMMIPIICITIFVIPKCSRFLGKTSIASYMGEYYGDKIRVITAFLGCFSVIGSISLQFKIIGILCSYLLPFIPFWGSQLLGVIVVTYYCYYGGIRSVIYTDIIQCIIFTIGFLVSLFLFIEIPEYSNIHEVDLSKFDPSYLLTLSKDQYVELLFLLTYFIIPTINPTEFQRISIGKNIKQIQYSWAVAILGVLISMIITCYISYKLFKVNPNLKTSDDIIACFISQFIYLKPVIIIGIISMAMSTADSHINISSIMFANDTYKRNVWTSYKKLQMARKYTWILGLTAYGLTFYGKNFLSILQLTRGLYIPLVTIPLIISVLKYKVSEKCVLISMGITFGSWITCRFILDSDNDLLFNFVLNGLSLFVTYHLIDKKILERFRIRSKLKGK
jgi:Na+/proline symporter